MRPALGWFPLLVAAGFRSRATYRGALVAGMVTNSVFGLIRGSVMLAAIAAAGGRIGGYTASTMAAYVWLGQALLGVINLFPRPALAGRVRTGDIALDYVRPVDIQLAYFAQDLGGSFYSLLPRALPTLAIGWLVTRFTLPGDATAYALGLLSIALGVTLSYCCRLALELLAFWFTETRGFNNLYMMVCGFAAGLYVPVGIMPGWLQTTCRAMPFPSMFQTPIDVLSGHVTGAGAAIALLVQVGWVAGIGLLGRWMLHAGHRRLVVQGG